MGTQGNGLNILSVSELVLAYTYSGLCGSCFVIVLMYPFFVCKITVSLFIFRFDMASDEKKEKWRQASKRYREKKLALDAAAWREEQRVRVAESRGRRGPPTDEVRTKTNEAARLKMEQLRARRGMPPTPPGHGHATRANVSTLINL